MASRPRTDSDICLRSGGSRASCAVAKRDNMLWHPSIREADRRVNKSHCIDAGTSRAFGQLFANGGDSLEVFGDSPVSLLGHGLEWRHRCVTSKCHPITNGYGEAVAGPMSDLAEAIFS